MKALTPKQMDAVKGGSKCGWLGFLTAVSCMAAMFWACGLGLAGYATLCAD